MKYLSKIIFLVITIPLLFLVYLETQKPPKLTIVAGEDLSIGYKIPSSFEYDSLSLNVYSYDTQQNQWNLIKNVSFDENNLINNTFFIYFIEDYGQTTLYIKLPNEDECTTSVSHPLYSIQNTYEMDSKRYTISNQNLTYNEIVLSMNLCCYGSGTLNYKDKYDRFSSNIHNYDLDMPLICDKDDIFTCVTVQFIK